MTEKRILPGGIDGEIRRLEIKRLCTNDPDEKEKILRRLVAARNCRDILRKLPGQEYLVRDGGTLHAD